jgi:hypothetical protein
MVYLANRKVKAPDFLKAKIERAVKKQSQKVVIGTVR